MINSKKLRIFFRVAVGLYAAAVGLLCFAKFDPAFIQEQSQLLHLTDKDVHFLMFVPFVPLMYLAFGDMRWKGRWFSLFCAAMIVCATAAAAMIELIQGQTDYRGEDLWDAVAGIAGAVTGSVLLAVFYLFIRKRRKKVSCPCNGGNELKNNDVQNGKGGKMLLAAATLTASSFLLFSSEEASAQSRSEFQECCDSLTARLQRRTGARSEELKLSKVLRRGSTLDFYFDRTLGDYPWHEGDPEWFRRELKSLMPSKYSDRTVGEIFSKLSPLKDFVTPRLGKNGSPVKTLNRVADPKSKDVPFVREQVAQTFEKGLSHRNIALWQSHGYYYEQSLDRWEWQRACLFQTVEDMFTQSFVLQFLVPMLENAGAYVMLPRERDFNTDEYIIDNDRTSTSRNRGSFSTEGSWDVSGPGFADRDEIISDSSNPFVSGTFLTVDASAKSRKNASHKAVWRPDFSKRGEYAVYVSYRSVPGSTDSARYIVKHLGGTSTFVVNQSIGGGTWVYLGTFPFAEGTEGCVILDTEGVKGVVCADAVRFGGGMGNIARKAAPSKGRKADHDAEVSGMPRFAEGARYSLQWSGAPESVWSQNEGRSDYKDDYMCRGTWVDWLSGGSRMNRKNKGLGIPVDLSFAFHTDAGVAPADTTIGTLAIYTSVSEGRRELPDGERRITSREFADIVQSQVVSDIRATYDPDWTRRGTKDRSYLESRTPTAPSMILELLSHQNFTDMKFGLDPAFRFTVSRSVYKGMLKYLSNRYGCAYAVQPLPVRSFSAEIGAVADDEYEVRLSWRPTEDRLEPTAVPKGYVLETRYGDGVFSGGTIIKNPVKSTDGRLSCCVKVKKGQVCSFRMRAYNDGGKSFPSEILSTGLPEGESSGNVLIVNNFTRVAAPSYIDTPQYAGFDSRNGGGVDYLQRINYIGEMYQFRQGLDWKDDDDPGFGASWTDKAGCILAGNSFDYPALHGKALLSLGYGFVSMSAEAFCEGGSDASLFAALDLICGKQGATPKGTGKDFPAEYQVFPQGLQQRLEEFTSAGGNLIVSGANIGTDLKEGINSFVDGCCGGGEEFASRVLGYRAMNSHASRSGVYRYLEGAQRNAEGKFATAPNPEIYCVEAPDGIVPANSSSRTFLRYKDTGISAGTVYEGNGYKAVCIGFPIETVSCSDEMQRLLGFCMETLR